MITFSCGPTRRGTVSSDIKRSYFANGSVQFEQQYQNGELHGLQVEYYANGNTRSSVPYRRGIPTGTVTEYYSNGNKAAVYEQDSLGNYSGRYKSFYSNGKTRAVGRYVWMPGYYSKTCDSINTQLLYGRQPEFGFQKCGIWKYFDEESRQIRRVRYERYYIVCSDTIINGVFPEDTLLIQVYELRFPVVR